MPASWSKRLHSAGPRRRGNPYARPQVLVSAIKRATLIDAPAAQPYRSATTMGKGKMSGDNSADSKKPASKTRGSGGTTKKSQDPGKQSNTKADNTKSNRQ
jgi:hypothetical protein